MIIVVEVRIKPNVQVLVRFLYNIASAGKRTLLKLMSLVVRLLRTPDSTNLQKLSLQRQI